AGAAHRTLGPGAGDHRRPAGGRRPRRRAPGDPPVAADRGVHHRALDRARPDAGGDHAGGGGIRPPFRPAGPGRGRGPRRSRAAVLVDELLDVARLHMGRPLELERRPTDLLALTREIAAEYQQDSVRHQILVETDVPELVGQWDSRRLARVIGNVLDNALKY